ncbi:DUF397 domain-containing protein [Amycolatopsis sp. NPDC058986]|uniref:DUF397 domain-containing protein n=1 Tax=unclassified Amycolatopsis TaxID=2618356 RepID=UPI0036709A0A
MTTVAHTGKRVPTRLTWRKSSYSGQNSDGSSECVELAELPDGGRAIRDSKLGDASGVLHTGPATWTALRDHLS